jgi:hypothetical protein
LLFCPLPWIIYAAFLSFRAQVITPSAVFLFAGTVCVAIAVIVGSVAVAALLPYVQLISHP